MVPTGVEGISMSLAHGKIASLTLSGIPSDEILLTITNLQPGVPAPQKQGIAGYICTAVA